jgi:hypothetical protein
MSRLRQEWALSVQNNTSDDDTIAVAIQAHAAYPGWVNRIHKATIQLHAVPTLSYLANKLALMGS